MCSSIVGHVCIVRATSMLCDLDCQEIYTNKSCVSN